MTVTCTLTAVPDIPLIQAGDDLAAIMISAIEQAGLRLHDRDVLVIAQKIVSKAENRYVKLAQVAPSKRAFELAPLVDKDPGLVEVILSESRAVVRYRPGVIVVEHRLGYVMANAGIDRSNIADGDGEQVLLLPLDPNASCVQLKQQLEAHFGVELAIIINDSVGRAWRNGTVGIALGAAGLPALHDLRGEKDLYGRDLQVTQVGYADEVAAAASLLMGQGAEGLPLVIASGLQWPTADDGSVYGDALHLIRRQQDDLFR